MHHLRNLLAGAACLVSSFGARPYPVNGGFAQDRRALRGDFDRVASGLRSAYKSQRESRKRDQPANAR